MSSFKGQPDFTSRIVPTDEYNPQLLTALRAAQARAEAAETLFRSCAGLRMVAQARAEAAEARVRELEAMLRQTAIELDELGFPKLGRIVRRTLRDDGPGERKE